MRRLQTLILALLLTAGLAPAGATTVAIAIRHHSEQEQAPVLAETVEQGAMEFLFGAGHIVFDQTIDPEDELFHIRSILFAEAGGAEFSFVLELEFHTPSGRGLEPREVTVIVFDVENEQEAGRSTVRAGELDGYSELDALAIAERLGAEAARLALTHLPGGSSEW